MSLTPIRGSVYLPIAVAALVLALVACGRTSDEPEEPAIAAVPDHDSVFEGVTELDETEVAVVCDNPPEASTDGGSDDPEQPPPPPPPSVGAVEEGESIRVTWTCVPGATHYEVLTGDCDGVGGCWPVEWNVAGPEYYHALQSLYPPAVLAVIDRTHDSLTLEWQHVGYSTDLFYSVTACNDSACSEPSSTSIRNPVQIDYYQVHQRSQQSGYKLIDARPFRSPYVDRDLQPDAVYYYTIQTCSDSRGCSQESYETAGLTESAGSVEAPSVPEVRGHKYNVSFGSDEAGVSWRTVETATYYEVYQDSQFDQEVSAPGTDYRDYNPNTSWGAFYTTSYQVRACNKAGCSPFSETVTIN